MFLMSLCINYQVILQKLSGHNVCIEIIESLSSKYLYIGKGKKQIILNLFPLSGTYFCSVI